MIDPMQAVLQAQPAAPAFPANSRYSGTETATWTRPDGTVVIYLKRRFLPDPTRLQSIDSHTVAQDERIDNIAAAALGDPLQYWRICDANNAMRPAELTETPGRRLRITLPAGVTGPVA
ncbi:LysM domain-containing protein [Dyella sp. BiH032]|uniref:LysM domain-containing protein n=1 Tax=Dyella sp. BiH032 TaxID=3075430 RepID=UPI00289346CC|nr:LysM domain-containing protein [Dyella sp. BiH032]WNL45685.1 LysM domain-containing protein [Dyella sp. BiH032]